MATNTSASNEQDRVVFVYNADSGFLNVLKDWTHKIISPSTYNCQLCALTYGNTGMHKKWRAFITNLSFETVFLHRDEFFKECPNLQTTQLPCMLIEQKQNKQMKLLLNAEAVNKQVDLDQLIETCSQLLKTYSKQ